MKRTIFNILSVAIFVVLMLALLISCNNNEPSIDADSEKEETVIYSVLLKDDRGQLLSDVVSYVFLDDERVDIEITNKNGMASFNLPKNEGYTVSVKADFVDFAFEESYQLTEGVNVITAKTNDVNDSASSPNTDNLPVVGPNQGEIANKGEAGNEGEDINEGDYADVGDAPNEDGDSYEENQNPYEIYKKGDTITDLTVVTMDGQVIKISELLETKKMVVLNFFYTDSDIYIKSTPCINNAYEKYSESIEIIGICPYPLDSETDINDFIFENGIMYPVSKVETQWTVKFDLVGYPTSIIIDRYGMIAMCMIGGITNETVYSNIFEYFTSDSYVQKVIESLDEITPPKEEKPEVTLSSAPKPVVKYLRILEIGEDKVSVRFNAIGSNMKFDIRYSDSEITEETFDSATKADFVITNDKETYVATINNLKADADNKHYIAVKAYADYGSVTLYSELNTIRAGGIEIIPLDTTRSDLIYCGEVIKSFNQLVDEQNAADPYHNTYSKLPTSKVPKYYWGEGELASGSYVPQYSTDAKYGMTLRPIIDLEMDYYVEAIYVYYGNESYPITVNTSSVAANYDTVEAWDGIHYTNENPASKGWTRIDVQKVTKYVQICYCDTTLQEDISQRVESQAPIEVLIYGYAVGEGDTISNDTQRERPTMGEFMGACGFTAGGGGNTTPTQLGCFGVLREYVNLGWVYNWSSFPNKATMLARSSMADFDYNYTDKYSALNVIPCLQWNEGSNPARLYDRTNGKLSDEIASEADKFKPETYAAYADIAYQYAARYGSTNNRYLFDNVSTHSTGTVKTALRCIKWLELGNEPNGEDQNGATPYQLAALTSAAYDGHQRTILADCFDSYGTSYFLGAKNADPNFKLAMAGLAGIGSNYITSMVYWMKANRTDGCIAMDAFNVHTYFGKYFTLNGQQICVGVSPEEYGLIDAMANLVEFRDKYYPNVEVWITEFGWDTNQSYETMTSAHAYGQYSGREVQAMWLARAYLALAVAGVDKATMYMVEDVADDRFTYGKYGTCGVYGPEVIDTYDETTGKLIDHQMTGKMIPKESYYILYTMKRALGEMRFQRELSSGNEDVWIYEFADDNGNYGYALWCPTSDGTKVDGYKLYVGDTTKKITEISNRFEDHRAVRTEYGQVLEEHTYTISGDDVNLVAENGYVSVDVSENPIYVIIGNAAAKYTPEQEEAARKPQ